MLFRCRFRRRIKHSTSASIQQPLKRKVRQLSLCSNALRTIAMGLRNGKYLNIRSVITGQSTSDLSQPSSSALPLLSFNPLSLHSTLTNATSNSTFSTTNINNNNNNNNNDASNTFIPSFYYSNLINHPSLDARQFYPIRLEILLDRPSVSREKQNEFGWNHEDRSMNIFVKHNDPCTFHRHVNRVSFSSSSSASFSLVRLARRPKHRCRSSEKRFRHGNSRLGNRMVKRSTSASLGFSLGRFV